MTTEVVADGAVTVDDAANSVWKCAALGDLENLTRLIERSPEAVNVADDEGHWPLQWAALNNRYPVLQYLLSKSAIVGAKDKSGATALHWAAVRCSLPCIEELLRAGADKESGDEKGHTAAHVAAQYGHTSVLYHLVLRWHCDYEAEDVDGRTPLHWAAFKGFHDIVRLLLVLGSSPSHGDREGCTPLHWAALKGNSEAATVLVQGGRDTLMTLKDATGSTAEELAYEKKHRMLALFLQHEVEKQQQKSRSRHWLLAAIIKAQFAPIVWVVGLVSVFCFVWKVYYAPSLPPPTRFMTAATAIAFSSCIVAFFVLAKVNVSDPGFIPQRRSTPSTGKDRERKEQDAGEYNVLLDRPSPESKLENLDCPAMWAGNWNQLCVTCKIVRPLRAKHDAYTNRCIEKFDHFCPWVGNSIGKKNHHIFILFVILFTGPIILGYLVSFLRLQQTRFFHFSHHSHRKNDDHNHDVLYIIAWLILNIPLLCTLVGLSVAQSAQAVQNMTTNEMANWSRYKHFRHPETGNFLNPFDRGALGNIHELCCPEKYPTLPTVLDAATMERVLAKADKKHSKCTSCRPRVSGHACSHDSELASIV